MLLRLTRISLLPLMALSLLVFCGCAYGQSVDPARGEFRLTVDAVVLQVADREMQPDGALSLSALRQQLHLERARFGETMTVDELHQVADAMTVRVRNLGFAFHTVYLPPQQIEDGQVEFRLQQGVLVDVHVINKTSLADKRFTHVFDDLTDKVLHGPAIEERVQALKAQSGFNVFPFYSRGSKPGEARLNLKVDPSPKRSFSLKTDNYGSASSGVYRLIAQYSEFQLTGHHDRLVLALLHSLSEVENTYGSVHYNLPFGSLNYAWDISASNNQFEVGDRYAALGLEGVASVVRTGFSRQLKHHPKHRSRMRIGVYEKRNDLNIGGDAKVQQEVSRVASVLWSKDRQWTASGSALNLVVELSHGQYEVADQHDGRFNKIDLSGLWIKGFASGRARNIVQLSLRGQYSDVALPSVENFSLTGAYGVRGFEAGGFSADTAFLGSLEWRLPSLLSFADEQSWRLEPYVIGDWATGLKEGVADGVEQQASFSSAGIGLRMSWGRHFNAQVSASKAVSGIYNDEKVEGDEQVLFEIRWH